MRWLLYPLYERHLLRALSTEERVPGSSAIARFVGSEAYEAAGGPVLRDLFARDDESGTWFEDPALLETLATAKLQTIAAQLAERWKWAVGMIEADWNATARYGRIEPQPAERTPEEQAEIGRLEARQAELAELDDDTWTEELIREAEAIEQRLDEIEGGIEARAVYTPEDLEIAGCIATVGHDGSLRIIEGLVRPEDMPKQTGGSGGAGAATADDVDAGTDTGRIAGPAMSAPMQLPEDCEAKARKEAGVGIGVADDLRSIRTALVKAHLAGDFDAAFDLMLFQLGRSVFTDGCRSHALDIVVRETADRPMTRMNDEDFAGWSPGEAMLADRSGLSFDWLTIEDDGESFAALRALPQAGKQALFAACVARTVKGQLAFEPHAHPELEATVARLDIDFASYVRPTADMYWSRINKSRILDIARATLGPSWASARAKNKKPVLAEAMEQAFAAGDRPVSLSAEMHAAALAWTLPGFAAFDTGRVDEEEAGDVSASETPPVEADAEPVTQAETAPADPPRRASTVESIEAPAVAERRAAAADGNGHDTPTASEPADGDGGSGEQADEANNGTAGDVPLPAVIAGAVDAMNAVPTEDGGPRVIVQQAGPVNGQDTPPDPLEIPAFLRRVN